MKLTQSQIERTRKVFEELSFSREKWRQHARDNDPVGLLYRYVDPLNIETVALIVACLSYGKQSAFRPIQQQILDQMGQSPVDYLLTSDPTTWIYTFDWFKYRYNEPEDLTCLFLAIRKTLEKHGTLKDAFAMQSYPTVLEAMTQFVDSMYNHDFCQAYGWKRSNHHCAHSPGFEFLLPKPSKGSACKRLNMFLRWLVRRDDIDVGTWRGDTSKLIIPLDTHINRISLELGLTDGRFGTSWLAAEDITDSLKHFNPTDPVALDFVLCNAGVRGEL